MQIRSSKENATAQRLVLGRPQASSVFPAPARSVLAASDYDDARRRNLKATGSKITKQASVILPRIREVDVLMRHSAKALRLVREIHPQACFWALNGRQPMQHRKKGETGFRERLNVLKCVRPTADWEITAILGHSRPKGIARDDALDDMAAALTAEQEASAPRMLPPCPPRDSAGLPMEMVYAEYAPA